MQRRIPLLIFALLICFSLNGYAQHSQNGYLKRELNFIHNWMTRVGSFDSTAFSDQPEWNEIKREDLAILLDVAKPLTPKDTAIRDTLFTTADVKDMLRQYQLCKNRRWTKADIPAKNLMSGIEINRIFKQSGIDGGWQWFRRRNLQKVWSVSVPLFNLKGDKVLFYEGYGCGGLCGAGHVAIYQFRNGKWNIVAIISSWVS